MSDTPTRSQQEQNKSTKPAEYRCNDHRGQPRCAKSGQDTECDLGNTQCADNRHG